MNRLALILAAATFGTGCFISTDDDDPGSVNLYWAFVRNAPAQTGGVVVYDASHEGSGTGLCNESGVEVVTVDSPAGRVDVDCVYQGVEGVGIDGIIEGVRSFRIRGWRGDYAVYDTTVNLSVRGNAITDYEIDVPAVSAPIDIVAYLAFSPYGPSDFYEGCNEAANPDVDFEIWDSFPSLVATGTVACPLNASAYPLPVFISDLDLDNYTVRMKGYDGASRIFDSCVSEATKFEAFDHFGTQIGVTGIPVTMFTPPACTEL